MEPGLEDESDLLNLVQRHILVLLVQRALQKCLDAHMSHHEEALLDVRVHLR